ncbi:hypothetical protein H0H93_011038, partial [Arthromyces matolae]
MLRIAGIIGDILSETIVILVTFRKTYKVNKDLELANVVRKKGLAYLMLRDDMLVLIFDHVPQPVVGYDYWVVPYYTPVFRTIIICRFILSLRSIYFNDSDPDDTGTLAQAWSLRFASSVIGPLGATVDVWDGDKTGDHCDHDFKTGDDVVFSDEPFSAGLNCSVTEMDSCGVLLEVGTINTTEYPDTPTTFSPESPTTVQSKIE